MYQVNNGPALAEIALSYAIQTPGNTCAANVLETAKAYFEFLIKDPLVQKSAE